MNAVVLGIALGSNVSVMQDRSDCYYFCDFDRAMTLLRRRKAMSEYQAARKTGRSSMETKEPEPEPKAAPAPGSRSLDLTGYRFGMLKVVGFAGVGKSRNALWRCVCDCGKEVTFTAAWLKRTGRAPKNCGCQSTRINKHNEDRSEDQGQK